MVDYIKIVEKINKDCKPLFLPNIFKLCLNPGHHNIYVYRIEGSSYALNRYDSDPVKVLKWFNKFWIFIEIKFIVEKKVKSTDIHTNISISVYEGEDNDNIKIQLFRAEWDDMNNPEELHSQPHWHITSSQAIEKTFEEYSNVFDNGEFINLLNKHSNSLFDVKKIHFAMNGNWHENKNHIHKVQNAEQISNWIRGLLSHIRLELEI